MDRIYLAICIGIFGLLFGSFAGAQVWRLRARQLVEDKAEGEEYDKSEYKQLLPLTKTSLRRDRSHCLSCNHELRATDLIPLVSWLSTGGKCRYCKKPIGWFEPLMELGTAVTMLAIFLLWPYGYSGGFNELHIAAWLIAVIFGAILFAYDFKWFLLPNVPTALLVLCGVVSSSVVVSQADHPFEALASIGGAVVVLSGIYAALWLGSRGRWIGLGDVKLGLGLALLLADWRLAFIALFAANLVGCIIVIPGMLLGKIARTTHVPFGPLLIIGTLIALLWGQPILDWYLRFL